MWRELRWGLWWGVQRRSGECGFPADQHRVSGFSEDGVCQGLYIVDGELGIDGNGSAVAEGLDGLGGAAREGLFGVCIAGAVEAFGDGEAAADRPDGRVEKVGEGPGALPTARSERMRI